MARTVAIGLQNFETIRMKNTFYIDKTHFIKEWWENFDLVTLIDRPRRFGKTLLMSMVEQFFSVDYAGREELFRDLFIWKEKEYRELQGMYPVISISFANVKETDYEKTRLRINQILTDLYSKHDFLLHSGLLNENERNYFSSVKEDMDEVTATMAVHNLSNYLSRYYGKGVIILLDEYDTPMQEAYVNHYWKELVGFTRSMFNSTFKTNPYLERAIMTGITRVSKESIFSDLNNLVAVTTTSNMYEDCFGFTEKEVFAALREYGLGHRAEEVKTWYDGFTFGRVRDIYNPWSILNFLKYEKLATYWANTSSNSLIGKLVREGTREIKTEFEALLNGNSLVTEIDEQIVYDQLDYNENAIWSLLLASGYLKVKSLKAQGKGEEWKEIYELELTNLEVKIMFRGMVRDWFKPASSDYNDFIKALLIDDRKAMNVYMNRVAMQTFSFFDSGNRPSKQSEPERFYHGFVLGMMVELRQRYTVTSNRESGFGRYDVLLEPVRGEDDAIIIEFKVFDPDEEKNLDDTVRRALQQIEEKGYAAGLREKGIPEGHIRKYGFAFEGKKVLIG